MFKCQKLKLLRLKLSEITKQIFNAWSHIPSAPIVSINILNLVDICGRGEKIVDLNQFGQEKEICSFNTSGIGKIQKVHFDPFGIRFGGCNSKGDLNIWKFDNSLSDMSPYIFVDNAHASSITDFTFVNSPNILASIGMNSTPSVCLWDFLQPIESGRTCIIDNLESLGILTYCKSSNLICIGGQKGKITRIDLRTLKVLDVIEAHSTAIKSLIVSGNMLFSGSRYGEVKVWDLTQMESVGHHYNLGSHNPTGHHTEASSLLGISQKNFDMHLLGDPGYLATTFEKTVAIWEQPLT